MKRIITFILAVTILFTICCSFSGCKKEITLTAENWKTYLFLETTFGDYKTEYIENDSFLLSDYEHTCIATITFKSKGDYKFENVSGKIYIPTPYGAGTLTSQWRWYSDEEHFNFNVDSNGNGSVTILLRASAGTSKRKQPEIDIHIKNIIGTVIEN